MLAFIYFLVGTDGQTFYALCRSSFLLGLQTYKKKLFIPEMFQKSFPSINPLKNGLKLIQHTNVQTQYTNIKLIFHLFFTKWLEYKTHNFL